MGSVLNIASIDEINVLLNSPKVTYIHESEYDALEEYMEIYNDKNNVLYKEDAEKLIEELEELKESIERFEIIYRIVETDIRDLNQKMKILPSCLASRIPGFDPRCPYCDTSMKLRDGKYGPFWACPYHFGVTRSIYA